MEKLKIEYVDINSIKPYKNNAKTHPQEQIDQIKKSIEQFGMDDPIGVWKDEIVEGHGRLIACKELGMTEVPIIRLDHLTDEERKAYTLAHNKLTMNSDFDIDILNEELANFETIDMSEFGFDLKFDTYEDELSVIEDEAPEVPDEPKSKLGEVYQLGNHRLMCGDSTNPDDVDKLMQDEMADLVFTDPPYGVSYKGTNNPNGREWEIIKNDKLRGDDLFLFLLEAFKNIKRKLKVGGAFYIWYANSNSIQFETALEGAELRKKQIIIWQKGMVLGHSDYHWTYEPCIYGCHPEANCEWYGDRAQKTLWDFNKKEIADMKKDEMQALLERLYQDKDVWEIKRDPVMEYVHPTQKPVELLEYLIKTYTNENEIVLDNCMGSGSTGIACRNTNRNFIGIELDEKYFNIAKERIGE